MKNFTTYLFLCLPVFAGILWGSTGVYNGTFVKTKIR